VGSLDKLKFLIHWLVSILLKIVGEKISQLEQINTAHKLVECSPISNRNITGKIIFILGKEVVYALGRCVTDHSPPENAISRAHGEW